MNGNNNNRNIWFKDSPQGYSVSCCKNLVFKNTIDNYFNFETTEKSLILLLVKMVVLCSASSNIVCGSTY